MFYQCSARGNNTTIFDGRTDTSGAPASDPAVFYVGASDYKGYWYVDHVIHMQSSTAVVASANWVHLAVSKNAGVERMYMNGALVDTYSSNFNYSVAFAGRPNIGCNANNAQSWKTWIDEFRITRGVGRYPAAFTPPTEPFPDA
jgi:hypothetical protein